MSVLIACEESQEVCKAFRARGHEAYSCDIQDCSGGHPEWHIKGDALEVAKSRPWRLLIAHPPCTRLANSGWRWLFTPPKGKTLQEMWDDFYKDVRFYRSIRNLDIPLKCIENSIFNKAAIEQLGKPTRHIVQPWWFGDKAFKGTGFELHGLPPLNEGVNSLRYIVPKPGTDEHKKWSWIHRMPPGPDRAKLRAKTFPGIAAAMAEQWGKLL